MKYVRVPVTSGGVTEAWVPTQESMLRLAGFLDDIAHRLNGDPDIQGASWLFKEAAEYIRSDAE